MKLYRGLFLLSILLVFWGSPTIVAREVKEPEKPVVKAILFFSPTCPHCHHVIMIVLPPLMDQYGDQLQIMGFDTSYEAGLYLYQTMATQFQVPAERLGMPTLIVGDLILVGSLEISEQFPLIIEEGLANGGIDWPDIPNLLEIVSALPPSTAPNQPATETTDLASADTPAPIEESALPTGTESTVFSLEEIDLDQETVTNTGAPPPDPVGFVLGWTVLFGMIAGLGYGSYCCVQKRPFSKVLRDHTDGNNKRTLLILGLLTIGLSVAGYLAYVETTHVAAVCGPVGECNIVQSSPYARIFGVPVAILGVLSYFAIGILWLLRQPLSKKMPGLPYYGLFALTLLGTIFSIYLTLLELLVIHAICIWCLTSAIITLLLFLVVVMWLTKRRLPINPGFEAGD